MLSQQMGGNKKGGKAKTADARRDYLRYLSQMRQQVRKTQQQQYTAQMWSHPDPAHLWAIVTSGQRLWERRPNRPGLRPGAPRHRLAAAGHPPGGPGDRAGRRARTDLRRRAAPLHHRPGHAGQAADGGAAALLLARADQRRRRGHPGRRARPCQGPAGPAGRVPRAGRGAGVRGRRGEPPPALGVGQVAAARAAPEGQRRGRLGPADLLRRERARGGARQRTARPPALLPRRPADPRPAAPDRHRGRRPRQPRLAAAARRGRARRDHRRDRRRGARGPGARRRAHVRSTARSCRWRPPSGASFSGVGGPALDPAGRGAGPAARAAAGGRRRGRRRAADQRAGLHRPDGHRRPRFASTPARAGSG